MIVIQSVMLAVSKYLSLTSYVLERLVRAHSVSLISHTYLAVIALKCISDYTVPPMPHPPLV